MLQKCFRDASEMLQRCFGDASEMLQRCFRDASEMLQRCMDNELRNDRMLLLHLQESQSISKNPDKNKKNTQESDIVQHSSRFNGSRFKVKKRGERFLGGFFRGFFEEEGGGGERGHPPPPPVGREKDTSTELLVTFSCSCLLGAYRVIQSAFRFSPHHLIAPTFDWRRAGGVRQPERVNRGTSNPAVTSPNRATEPRHRPISIKEL